MARKTRGLLAAVSLGTLILGGCSSTDEPTPQRTPAAAVYVKGYQPVPSAVLDAYATCLRGQGAKVREVIGGFIVVDALPAAGQAQACQEQRKKAVERITGVERKIPDEVSWAHMQKVRLCMMYHANMDLEIEPVFDASAQAPRTEQFYACVEEIRNRPNPSQSPSVS